MKKVSILHYALIITGIVLAYNACQTLFSSMLLLGIWLIEHGGRGDSEYFPNLINYLYLLFQILAAWWLITKSGNLSLRIAEKTGANDGFKIVSSNKQLLQIVFTSIGIYFIIFNASDIFNFMVDEYRMRNQYKGEGKSSFAALLLMKLLTILPGWLLTAYAGELSLYLTKKSAIEPITIQQDIEAIGAIESSETDT
jgi:hypothetical protein